MYQNVCFKYVQFIVKYTSRKLFQEEEEERECGDEGKGDEVGFLRRFSLFCPYRHKCQDL